MTENKDNIGPFKKETVYKALAIVGLVFLGLAILWFNIYDKDLSAGTRWGFPNCLLASNRALSRDSLSEILAVSESPWVSQKIPEWNSVQDYLERVYYASKKYDKFPHSVLT